MIPDITLNDGNTIPQLGFGTWLIRSDQAFEAVTMALQTGYRHIDTAAIYGNEAEVGRAILESGIPRSKIFVTTKVWNDRHGDAEAACAESLDRLGLNYVDLYLIHWPAPGRNQYVGAWQTLTRLKDQGLTRSIGVSNFTAVNLLRVIDETGVVPAVNQIEVHPTLAQRELIAVNTRHQVATEAWSPLGRARDLGIPAIVQLAEDTGRTPAQVVLRWHVQHGYIVFPKSVSLARIQENYDIFGFELSQSQMAVLDGLDAGTRFGPDPHFFGNDA